MKIAVLADIHANINAFQAAIDHLERWQPDSVILAGDLVNRGPRPKECLELALDRHREDGWLFVRGNHEDYVIQHAEPNAPRDGPAFEVHQASYWTYQKLNEDVTDLRSMPDQQLLLDPENRIIEILHGSKLGKRDGIYPETDHAALRKKVGIGRSNPRQAELAVFAVGHTHRPFVRYLDGVLVVNAGSVGLPFDKDSRLAYAQLTWENHHWNARIIRLEYDLAQAKADFYRCGYIENAGALAQLVQIELLTATSHLYHWALEYQQLALEGRITVEESVKRYLKQIAS